MTKPTVTCERFDLVRLPLPFADREATTRWPALIISSAVVLSSVSQAVLTMITSADHSAWPLDHRIQDLEAAGLHHASVVRFKLFTLDDRLILENLGQLGLNDQSAVRTALGSLFAVAGTQ
jgi:mRNA interferase MazF